MPAKLLVLVCGEPDFFFLINLNLMYIFIFKKINEMLKL